MPKKTLPRIVAVTADKKPLTLRIRWDKGDESLVDVSGLIETFRAYEPLRRAPELFAQVRLGEHGIHIHLLEKRPFVVDLSPWHLFKFGGKLGCS